MLSSHQLDIEYADEVLAYFTATLAHDALHLRQQALSSFATILFLRKPTVPKGVVTIPASVCFRYNCSCLDCMFHSISLQDSQHDTTDNPLTEQQFNEALFVDKGHAGWNAASSTVFSSRFFLNDYVFLVMLQAQFVLPRVQWPSKLEYQLAHVVLPILTSGSVLNRFVAFQAQVAQVSFRIVF